MNQIPNLLIVDDDKGSILLLKLIIRKIPVNIINAYSGEEALEKTKGIDLALAIIDVQMPIMNGYELAARLNEERAVDRVPVIFLTATFINDNEILKGYNTGAVDYLLKPAEPHILISKINVFLELHNQRLTIQKEAVILKNYTNELTRVNLALKESKEKYRSYIDNAPDGVFVVNNEGQYLEVNNAASRITGYSKEELQKMSITDLMPEEFLAEGLRSFNELVNSGKLHTDFLFLNKKKERRWMSLNSVRIGDALFIGFAKDVTLRKEMEDVVLDQQCKLEIQNLQLSRAKDIAEEASRKYSELYDSAPSCYFTLSNDNTILELNYSAARMLGRNRSELIGSHFETYISKNSLPAFCDFFLSIFKNDVKKACELMIETEVNGQRYVHAEGTVIIESKLCQINLVDISERKLAEQTLTISEEKYRTMLNASPDGILLMGLTGIITEASEIALELFGAEGKEDMIGKEISVFVPDDENATLKDIFEKTMTEGLVQNIGLKIRKKNLTVFPSEASVTLIQGSDKSPLSFMFIIRDISQRTKIEAAQIHASRMASLGEMASGIAHEINQPLNIISMVMDKILFESARTDIIESGFLKNKSDKIFENITRIRNIIDHVRTFSRNNNGYISSSFDINSAIENALSMISEQFKYLGINMILNLDRSIPLFSGNTYQFEQVILNLLINAKDAVIEKKNRQDEEFDQNISTSTYVENNSVIVEIADSGIGISKDNIASVMLPFFTTKEAGKGTGLGLSICYQFIKEMGGTIEISSEEGTGTKVKLNLIYQKIKS
jgi:PAS domain S-box-containing protein